MLLAIMEISCHQKVPGYLYSSSTGSESFHSLGVKKTNCFSPIPFNILLSILLHVLVSIIHGVRKFTKGFTMHRPQNLYMAIIQKLYPYFAQDLTVCQEVQAKLHRIWERLQCTEAQQMDMAIKYSSSHLSSIQVNEVLVI